MADLVAIERERCASIAADLATKWEKSAQVLREKGRVRFFFIGPSYVKLSYETAAQSVEAAAHGLRAIEQLIREGATKR